MEFQFFWSKIASTFGRKADVNKWLRENCKVFTKYLRCNALLGRLTIFRIKCAPPFLLVKVNDFILVSLEKKWELQIVALLYIDIWLQ